MLGKLMKHEWRAVWKVPTLLIGVILFCSLAAGASFALPIWDSEWVGVPISAVMVLMLFYFVIIGCSLGTTIYFAVRYYKNMYTDEGYLLHTLPVTGRQLLLSKVLTMASWNLIAVIAVLIGVGVFLLLMANFIAPDFGWAEVVAEVFGVLDAEVFDGWQIFCVVMILYVFVSAFYGTMVVVGSINIGQMVRKHRILGAVGAYFAITFVIQTITTVLMIPIMMITSFAADTMEVTSVFEVYNPIYGIMAVVFLVVGIVLYFISEYLVNKKLELE